MTEASIAQTQNLSPVTTGVMVILTAKSNVTREQVMAVMPAEVRQTVQLYVGGKIREWFSRADGRGAVFLLDTRDVAEAHAIMDDLPLARASSITSTSRSVRCCPFGCFWPARNARNSEEAEKCPPSTCHLF
ncbi:hypothetical protein [Bradyrhizobium sp. WSM1253]|uniref:hypothetical protein n=1 Tax=Bradyrhizobium sp. WSM1253 TaxID=319003 RepID=UPI001FD96925|nr:hypothetical protein [Bradyrhizobium sp. WSM1253]